METGRETQAVSDLYAFIPLCDEYEIISFDLFDTLIYRRFFSFEEVKSKVFSYIVGLTEEKYSYDQVKFIYEHTNNLLKDSIRVDSDEPLLIVLYKTILSGLKLDSRCAEEVVKYELGLEKQNLVLFDDVKGVLKTLASKKKKMVITSDMYFSKEQILSIVRNVGIEEYFSEIHVSSEYGERKHTSKLFKLIFPEPSKVIHIGDNHHGDYKQALKRKINAVHLDRKYANAKVSHLDITYVQNKQHLSSLISEVFSAMIMRTFDYALTHDIKKIYFLSRDATPIYDVAKIIVNNGLPSIYRNISVHELCVGRNALGYLDVRKGKEFLTDVLSQFAWLHHGQVNLQDLMELFGINDIKIDDKHQRLKWSHHNSAKQVAKTIQKHYPQLDDAIKTYVTEQNKLAMTYLENCGAIGSGKAVFADVGYTGTVLRLLCHHIAKESTDTIRQKTDIHMLLLATTDGYMTNSSFSQSYGSIKEGVVLHGDQLPGILKTNFSWLEVFFKNAIPERGPLIRYQENTDGGVEPVFRKNTDVERNPLLDEITEKSVEMLSRKDSFKYLTADYLSQIRNLMIQTFQFPSNELIEVMKSLKQEFSPLETESKSIIYNAGEYETIKKIHYMEKKDYWVAGSLQANGAGKAIAIFDEIKKSKNKVIFWLLSKAKN